MRQPYLVVGAGFDVPTGIPRQMKSKAATAPVWWQRDGEGTVFRIGGSPDLSGWFAVNVWWTQRQSDLPEFPDEALASGRNTVDLSEGQGVFLVNGSRGDL